MNMLALFCFPHPYWLNFTNLFRASTLFPSSVWWDSSSFFSNCPFFGLTGLSFLIVYLNLPTFFTILKIHWKPRVFIINYFYPKANSVEKQIRMNWWMIKLIFIISHILGNKTISMILGFQRFLELVNVASFFLFCVGSEDIMHSYSCVILCQSTFYVDFYLFH